MKVLDCVWEIDNIGKKTCEVIISNGDIIDYSFIDNLNLTYNYQVLKVEPGNVNTILFLQEQGFRLIETQIDVELKYKDFDFDNSLIKYLEQDISFVDVVKEEDLKLIIDKITPEMFVSDRISLDPLFGPVLGCQRYCNWMRTAFRSGSASFYQIKFKDEHIGFSMFRIKGGTWHGDLGGIYPSAGQGLGLLTACAPFLYMKQRGLSVIKLNSSISSNNIPVLSSFNHCRYNFKKFKYIFVKHIN